MKRTKIVLVITATLLAFAFSAGAAVNSFTPISQHQWSNNPFQAYSWDAKGWIDVSDSPSGLSDISDWVIQPDGLQSLEPVTVKEIGQFTYDHTSSLTTESSISTGTIDGDWLDPFGEGSGDGNGGGPVYMMSPDSVPEPATLVLFGLGLAGVSLRRRFKK